MNKLLAGTPVLALVLGTGIALADQVVGSVEYVDAQKGPVTQVSWMVL